MLNTVFPVYAGDLGQNPKSEQQMLNQLSRQQGLRRKRGGGEEHEEMDDWKDRREMENGQNLATCD